MGEVGEYRRCLEEQLAEVELLQAMFPGVGELQVEEEVVEEMRGWLEGRGEESPPSLEVRLVVGEVEVVASLPPTYPSLTLPMVYLRLGLWAF